MFIIFDVSLWLNRQQAKFSVASGTAAHSNKVKQRGICMPTEIQAKANIDDNIMPTFQIVQSLQQYLKKKLARH